MKKINTCILAFFIYCSFCATLRVDQLEININSNRKDTFKILKEKLVTDGYVISMLNEESGLIVTEYSDIDDFHQVLLSSTLIEKSGNIITLKIVPKIRMRGLGMTEYLPEDMHQGDYVYKKIQQMLDFIKLQTEKFK